MNAWDHPLIRKGMTAQFAARRARIAAGGRPLGWKLGLGASASLQKLGLSAPAVGFLMREALLAPGSTVSLKDYRRPVAEPEIAVRLAHGLAPGATADTAIASIADIRPAIELADLDPLPAPDNLDVVLAGDIYQRHVLLGTDARAGGSLTGLTSRVMRRGAEVNRTNDLEALTGKLPELLAHVAALLSAFGETLAAGDVIITGSITPPPMIEPDETDFVHAVDPIGAVSVHFTR